MKKKKTISLADLQQSKCARLNPHLFRTEDEQKKILAKIGMEVKKSKYNNKKHIVDGIEFDSEKEAARYGVLRMRMKAGEIGLIELQKVFELNEEGEFSYKYKADFVYVDMKTGETIVEDTKGFLTREYKKKRRLMKKIYNITILET